MLVRIRLILPLVVAAVVLLASGTLYGLWTDRWQLTPELQQAADRVANLPLQVGAWQGEEFKLTDQEIAMAGLAGYASRRYVHKETNQAVTVLLVCGRPGPISRHTPDVCYRGAGFEYEGRPAKHRDASIPESGEYWTLLMSKHRPTGSAHLRILWAWNVGDGWQASDSPRWDYVQHPALYKLYVIEDLAHPESLRSDGPIPAFQREVLPTINRTLFPSPA